jgi:hypothetical protein
MSDNIAELVARLEEEAERLSGHSIDRSSVDAGISSNLATEAAQALTRIAGERDKATAHAMTLLRAGQEDRQLMTETAATVTSLRKRAEAAEDRCKAMEAALKPFSRAAHDWSPTANDGHVFEDGEPLEGHIAITVGDLRRAREALRGETK